MSEHKSIDGTESQNVLLSKPEISDNHSDSTDELHIQNQALRVEAERYKTILDSAVEAILVADVANRQFYYANKAACEMFGYTAEELLRLDVRDIHPEKDVDYVLSLFKDQAEGKVRLASDVPCIRKNGEVFFTDIDMGNIIIDGIEYNTGFFLDVTERRNTDDYNERRDLRIRKFHAAIIDILSAESVIEADMKKALETITKIAGETLDVQKSGAWLFDEEEERLTGVCIYDCSTKRFSEGEVFMAKEYPEYFKAIMLERAVDAQDANSDPRTFEFKNTYFKRHRVESVLDAAIRLRGRVMGVVSFEHVGERRKWTSDEISFAGEIADQVAKILVQNERKRALRAANDSEARYRSAINSMSDAIHVIDRNFNIVIINNSIKQWNLELGLETEIVGKNIFEIYSFLTENIKEEYLRVFRTGEVLTSEECNVVGNDEIITETRKIPVYNDNKITQIITVIRDITEKKRAERELNLYRDQLEELVEKRTEELEKAQEKLIASERLAILGKFSGSLAHEIRNPLGVISLSAHFLKRTVKDIGDKQLRHLDKIVFQVDRMADIIESIMKLTRRESPVFKSIEISGFIESTIESAQIPESIEIVKRFPEDDLFVELDRKQMEIAINNIIKNALQAMEVAGKLTLTVSTVDSGGAKYALVTISDTGGGLPENTEEKVFEPLFTTKTYGIGFGLTIVGMIVEQHGGTVKAVSRRGEGTDITIKLPVEK